MNHFPVHMGMPTPSPSSEPLKLTSVPAVEEFLAKTPFASRLVASLTGGNVNHLYRVHLLVPFEGSQTVVLKHAQPVLKNSGDITWVLERQVRARVLQCSVTAINTITEVRSGSYDACQIIPFPHVSCESPQNPSL
jgi:hypothetical protein